ncbi:MAG TPA: glycosyltransferase family 39 protein [bacterium]|nr:glycosyltransferase family 39 protein [bacterium]
MKAPSNAGKVFWAAASVWSALVFVHYFPLPGALDLSFLGSLPRDLSSFQAEKFFGTWILFLKNLLGVFLIGLVFYASGARLLAWMGLDPGPFRGPLALGLGALGLGIAWTALGLNGLWYPGLLKLVLVGLSLGALVELRAERFTWADAWGEQERGTKGFLLLGGLFGVLSLMMGSAPDVFYDGLVYHLSTLQAWLDRHTLVDLPTNLYTYYPFGGEMVLLNGFLFGGSEGAKLLNVGGLVLTAWVAGLWAAEEAGAWAGAATWAMVMTVPLFNATVWTSQVDVLLAFFLFLFLLSLGRSTQKRGAGWALCAGCFAGAALSVKFTAGLGILLALGGSWALRRGQGRRWILIGSVAFLLLAPWLMRNLALRADPLYPYPFLGWGGSLPPASLASLLSDHEASWIGHPSFTAWLQRVLTRDLDRTTAPLVLGLLPLLFFWRGLPGPAKFLGALGGVWLLAGFGLSHQPRLVIPAFGVLLIAAGMGLGQVRTPGWRRWAVCVLGVFGVLSFLSLGRLAFHYYRIDRVWSGAESQRDYLAQSPQTDSYFSLAQAAARVLPAGGRSLVVGDARGLYYPGEVVTNSFFDPQVPELLSGLDPDGMRRTLREMGIDALVVSGTEGTRLFGDRFPYSATGEPFGNWAAFKDRWLQPLYVDGKSAVFLLRDRPAR